MDGKVVHRRPVLVFKGKGNILQNKTKLYDKRIIVFFQEKAVVDGSLMVDVLGKRFAVNPAPISLVLDRAKQLWTAEVKAEKSRKLIPSRVPAGMTSYCQWLDAYWMFLFQTK